MEIDYKLQKDIEAYCELNEIEDISKFASGLLRKAFNIEKYGERPSISTQKTDIKEYPIIKEEEKIMSPPVKEEPIVVKAEKKRGHPKKEETPKPEVIIEEPKTETPKKRVRKLS